MNSKDWNIKNLISSSKIPRMESYILLENILSKCKSWMIANDDYILSHQEFQCFFYLVSKRIVGIPIAYLIGRKEFMSINFKINSSVLIPRPETELLVELVIKELKEKANNTKILDLGTGSGIIAITLASYYPEMLFSATDISLNALNAAIENSRSLFIKNIEFFHSDWYDGLSKFSKFDLIVSNPPYLKKNDHHLKVGDLRFEPRIALVGSNNNGLENIRKIIENSVRFLNDGGSIWIEHGFDQSDKVSQFLFFSGFQEIQSFLDFNGIKRVTKGYWSSK